MRRCIPVLCLALAMGSGLAQADEMTLKLDPANYTSIAVTLDGRPMTLRRYDAVYVGNPVAMAAQQPARRMGPGGSPSGAETQVLENLMAYQSLAIFVPEASVDNTTTAMILNVNNGGWFASELRPSVAADGAYVSTSDTDKTGAALAQGYVIVDVGTRGRGIVAADGSLPGKAPAAVVDAKAAIRFLRLNDAVLPGSAERIVITGTSGGGGLSAVVAASGNSADYLPDLAAIGAAGVSADGTSTLRDDVFATIAYCPITDLGHADLAYEWQYRAQRNADSTLSETARTAAGQLADAYPAYLDGLGLPVTAATMEAELLAALQDSALAHIAAGGKVPAMGGVFTVENRGEQSAVANTWLTVAGGDVQVNMPAFLTFVNNINALKAVPAFDRTANTGNQGMDGENTLFGPPTAAYSNFTAYGWNANEVAGDGSGPDDTGADWQAWLAGDGAVLASQLQRINPMAYLNTDADAAPYWYIRHGMIDRDTAFPVPLALAAAVRGDAQVKGVNFRLAWMMGHAGDYDVREAYGWLSGVLAEAGPPAE